MSSNKLLLLAGLLLICIPLHSQTPGIVTHVSHGASGSSNGQSAPFFQVDPCVSGQTWLVPYNFAAGSGVTSVTVSDDKGDTFAYAKAQPGETDANQVANIAYVACTTGAEKITITFTGGTPTYVSSGFTALYNVGSETGKGGNTGTGTSATCASIGANTDLLYNYVIQDSGTLTQPGFTAGSGMTALSNDLYSQGAQQFYQWRVQTAASNPGATLSSSLTWNSTCLSFAPATAASAPSGLYIAHQVQVEMAAGGVTSYTVPIYLTGTAAVVAYEGGSSDVLSVPTDTESATWASCGGGSGTGVIDGTVQVMCVCNLTASSTYKVTLVRSNTTDADHVVIYDIVGANSTSSSACADTRQTNTGNQASAGTLSLPSYTPAASTEIVLATLGVDTNTVAQYSPATAPSGAIFDCRVPVPQQQDDPSCENDGWWHYYSSSTSSETWTANEAMESAAYGAWASITVGIEAPAAGGTCSGHLLLQHFGC